QPLLRRLVVVGRHDQQAVGSRALGGPGELHTVPGVVGSHTRHHGGAIAHRLDHRAQDAIFLLVGGGGRLAGRAAHDQAVVTLLIDQIGGETPHSIVVDLAVRGERRDHRGQHATEGGVRGCRCRCHKPNGTRTAAPGGPRHPALLPYEAVREGDGRPAPLVPFGEEDHLAPRARAVRDVKPPAGRRGRQGRGRRYVLGGTHIGGLYPDNRPRLRSRY